MVRFILLACGIWLGGSMMLEYYDQADWFWMLLLPVTYVAAMPLLYQDD